MDKYIVMGATYLLALIMLAMTWFDPSLWGVELFKTLITVTIVTGCINMILAYYFSVNSLDQTKAENTGKAFEAIIGTKDGN